MSRMMRSGKPPLARSPIRLRPRRPLQPNSTPLQTTPGSLSKTQLPKRSWDVKEETDLRPEYRTISCELRALAKMVNQEFGENDPKLGSANANTCVKGNRSPLFERGRFYEEYSARRNERLKRKKSETGIEKKSGGCDYLGVRVESAKGGRLRKFESARKSVPATPVTERRYALRSISSSSMKENKKPPVGVNFETSSSVAGRKTVARRAVRK